MKTKRQTKLGLDSEKPGIAKKVRRSVAKTSSGTNGKNPLVSYEYAPIGIVECSPEGAYINVNEEFCHLLGYEKEDLIGKSLKEITHEDDYAVDIKLHQQLVEDKIPFYRLEERYIHKAGGIIWVELTRSVVRDATGTPLKTIGVVLDISDRKHVERVLRDSAERLRLATQAARMFMWELDLKNRIFTFADNFADVLGFSAGLLPKNNAEIVEKLSPAEDVQALWDAVAKAIENHDDLYSLRLRVINPENGQTVWLEANAKIVYNENGTVERMFGVAQNITENKKTQDEILIISRMPEENPNPVMRMTQDGKVLYANGPSATLLKSWEENTAQAIPAELQAHVAEVFTSGLKKEIEIENAGKVFSATLAPILEAGYVNFYGNDITERKHAEEKLRQQSEILEWANVVIRDLDSRIISWNKGAEQLYGWPKEEALGKVSHELFKTKFPVSLEDTQEKLFAHDEWKGVLEHIKRDGTPLIVLSHQVIHRDPAGKPVAILENNSDITARRQIERQQEALYQLTDQLHRTNSLDDVFNAALDAILAALQCDRASILLFDNNDVMRFVAWRGLSDEYRKATDGHSPWKSDEKDAEPICMNDVNSGDLSDSLRVTIKNEGIGALAFIPLVSNGKLIGKFMMYYNAPHAFSQDEVELSLTIARQLAFGVDRKRTDEALARERELLDRLFQTMPVMVSMYDPKTNSLRLNAEFERRMGWKTEELTIGSMLESIYPDPDYRTQVIQRMSAAGPNDWVEVQVRTREGRALDSIWANISLLDDRYIGIGVDITERKQAEEQIRESEEKYRRIVETASEGIWEIDKDTRTIFVNARMAEILGYTIDEMLGHSSFEFVFPEDYTEGERRLESAKGGMPARGSEFRYRRKDGSTVWLMASNTPKRDEQGNFVGAFAMMSDVTDRKRNEEALRVSEQRFREIFETAGVSVWLEDFTHVKTALEGLRAQGVADFPAYFAEHPDFVRETINLVQILDVNNETLDLFKARNKKDLLGSLSNVFAPETENIFVEELLALAEGRERLRAETKVRTLDGKPISVLFTVHFAPSLEDQSHVVVTLTDITERKRAEEDLRASETLYRTIARSIPGGGIYVVDKDMRYIVADGAVTEAFGLSREMLEGHMVTEVFRDEQPSKMLERLKRNFAGETISYETEHNGRVYWTQQAPLLGSIGQVIIVTLDITERKQMEEALRQSEERFSQFMQHLPGLAWIKDKQGRYIYANASAEAAFRTPLEKLYGKTDEDVFSPEVATQFKRNDDLALLDKNGVQVVETLEHDDGILHYSLVNKFPIPGPEGDIALIGGTAVDITERKQAEEALRRNEKMFSTLVDAAPFGVYFIDSEFRLRAINKGSEAVFSGIHPLIGRDFAEIIHIIWQEPFASEVVERFRHTLLTGESFISPTVIEERANIEEIQSYDWQIHRITLSDGTLGVVCYFYDLSEQKQMEAAVRASEERYRNLFDLVPVAVYSCDARGLIQEYNHSAVELWGREPAKNNPDEKFCGSFKIYDPDGRFMPHEKCPMARMLKGETLEPHELEIVIERPDGVRRSVIAHPLPIRNAHGEIVEAINCLYDITERKQAEDALQSLNVQLETRVVMRTAELQEANTALQESRGRLQILSRRLVEVQEEERRAIARELHDRVGQSLSALNINMIIMRDQLLPDSLERVTSRLSDSMHLVGETITLVRDVMSNLRPAVLDDYGLEAALQSYVNEYMARYGIKVVLEKPAQPLPRLGPSIEMTFLRIAQEALMNIARHANASQATLSLWQEGDSTCMTVQDNGSGIVSWQEANRPGSHGLTIMRERAEAFGGNLKVGSVPGKGTKVEMSIPIGKGNQNEVQKEMLE